MYNDRTAFRKATLAVIETRYGEPAAEIARAELDDPTTCDVVGVAIRSDLPTRPDSAPCIADRWATKRGVKPQ